MIGSQVVGIAWILDKSTDYSIYLYVLILGRGCLEATHHVQGNGSTRVDVGNASNRYTLGGAEVAIRIRGRAFDVVDCKPEER